MAERFANVETMVEFVKKYTPCINGETTMECVERSIRNAPTIDRINPFGNYEPKNCRWITLTEQAKNKRKSYEPFSQAHENGVKIPVISMEDVPKIMEEMEK